MAKARDTREVSLKVNGRYRRKRICDLNPAEAREWEKTQRAVRGQQRLIDAFSFRCLNCGKPVMAGMESRIREGRQKTKACPWCSTMHERRGDRWILEGQPIVDLHAGMDTAPLPPKSSHSSDVSRNPSKAADNIHLGHVYDYCQHCGKELPGGHHARQRFCNDAHRQAHGRQVRRAKFA